MKKALNAWTVDNSTGFEEMFKQLKEAGFEGIELNLDAVGSLSHSLTFDTTDSELEYIKSLSEQYNLEIVSISTSLLGEYGIGLPNEEMREMSKKVIRTQLRFAKALGAPGILVVPGGIQDQKSIAKAYETSMQTLKELGPEIEAAGLYVGVENVWNGFFMSPYDMMVFVDETKNPYVCAYFDVGNVVAFSWPEYWIEILGERAKFIHVKGFRRTGRSYGGLNTGGTFVDLLDADIEWGAVTAALRTAGYDGYLTAELASPEKDSDFVDYYKGIASSLDKIINGRI